jgi:hypothetical protein
MVHKPSKSMDYILDILDSGLRVLDKRECQRLYFNYAKLAETAWSRLKFQLRDLVKHLCQTSCEKN